MTARAAIVLVLLAVAGGCNEEFNPVVGYRDLPVVYGVLDSFADTQYVRVYTTYNAPGHDPRKQTHDTPITNATVTVDGGGGTWAFQGRWIPRWSTDRYLDSIFVYVNPAFRPQRGSSFTLALNTPIGPASSETIVPPVALLFVQEPGVLQAPYTFNTTVSIVARAHMTAATYAFKFQLLLDYEISVPGGWEGRTIEIPQALANAESIETYAGVYPSLRRRTTAGAIDPTTLLQKTDDEQFQNGVYRRILELLRQKYRPGTIRFLRARVIVFHMDEQLYKYYRIANGFSDPFSVRTDEPDYSNISGGRGLFGILARDTVSYTVPLELGR